MLSVTKLEKDLINFQVAKHSEFNENLIKQSFHSRSLDMRLVIANLAL